MKTIASLVVSLAAICASSTAGATGWSVQIPAVPFQATATATVNAYHTPGKNRVGIIQMGSRIEFTECIRSYCLTKLSNGQSGWVSLEFMKDLEHTPRRIVPPTGFDQIFQRPNVIIENLPIQRP